jgi:hypothetical protein
VRRAIDHRGAAETAMFVDAMLNFRACSDHFDKLLLMMTLSSTGLPVQWFEA